jgi:hypothetical protein
MTWVRQSHKHLACTALGWRRRKRGVRKPRTFTVAAGIFSLLLRCPRMNFFTSVSMYSKTR